MFVNGQYLYGTEKECTAKEYRYFTRSYPTSMNSLDSWLNWSETTMDSLETDFLTIDETNIINPEVYVYPFYCFDCDDEVPTNESYYLNTKKLIANYSEGTTNEYSGTTTSNRSVGWLTLNGVYVINADKSYNTTTKIYD